MRLFRIFWAIVISVLLTACGGGSSSSSTTPSSSNTTSSTSTASALSAYRGNLNPAALTVSNSNKFLQMLFGPENISETVSARTETAQPSGRGILTTDIHSLSSLLISQIDSQLIQQRNINIDTGNCNTGNVTLSGTLDDNTGTGSLNVDFQNCAYGGMTANGSALLIIHEVNSSTGKPTAFTISMENLSVIINGTTYKLTGTQRLDLNSNTAVTTVTSNLRSFNTSTGEETLSQNLVMLIEQSGQGKKISGSICHHIYGCSNIASSSDFRFEGSDGLPSAGTLTLTGLNNSSIQTLYSIDNGTGWRKFTFKVDADGNGTYEYTNALQSVKELTGLSNTPPIAQVFETKIISQQQGSPVTLSGFLSYDPDGDGISASWKFKSKPAGSKATLSTESVYNNLDIDLIPDIYGTYEIILTITDERGASSQANITVELQRMNYSPYAVITAPSNVAVSTKVLLDASHSSDSNNDPLSYEWSITSKPAGSTTTLLNSNNVQSTFTPDMAGTYEISLTVDDGYYYGTRTVTQTINAANFNASKLTHDTIDAEYSDALDKAVIVSSQPANKLYLTDPSTGTEQSVSLALPPSSVAVSPDGKQAVVGHDGAVTLVNLETLQILATHTEIGFNIADIVLKSTQKAYASETNYNWKSLYEIDLQTGIATPHSSINYFPLYGNAFIKLQPGTQNIYAIERGLSPADLKKFDVSTSPPAYLYDSPYHGDYPMGSDFWFSDDGSYILTAGGTMFRATSTQSTDMGYIRSISANNDYTKSILAADHSANAGKFVTVSNISDDYFEPRYAVRTYTTQLLTLTETDEFAPLSLNGNASLAEPAYAFFNATGINHYVLLKQDNDSFLLTY